MPQLGPTEIDDVILGCGVPGGELGFNLGRIVAVLPGQDHVQATTITRFCSSSLQITQMAMHPIKAGEDEVFIPAGVETVSRYARASSDSRPDTESPVFAPAKGRTTTAAEGGGGRRLDSATSSSGPIAHSLQEEQQYEAPR